jgi:hypothetical protein
MLGVALAISIGFVFLMAQAISKIVPKRKLYEITYSGCADYTDLYSAWSEQGAIRQWKKHHSRTVYRITEIKCVGKTRL